MPEWMTLNQHFPILVVMWKGLPNQWRSQPKMFGPASSAGGARFVGGYGGILLRKILKTRASEMPFPAISAPTFWKPVLVKKGHI